MTEDVTDAGPARQHVKMLLFKGLSYTDVSKLADVPRSTVVGLMVTGERQWASIGHSMSDRLCAVPIPAKRQEPNAGGANSKRAPDEDVEESGIPTEHVRPAQLVAASYAKDPDDLRMLLSMLGLDGMGTPLCSTCGDPITRAANEGCNQPGSNGVCGRCLNAANKRAEREAAKA